MRTPDLKVPEGARGTLRLYIVDPDNFQGGRTQTIRMAGESVGTFSNFQDGRWIEVAVGKQMTADGKVRIHAINETQQSNAVISIIEWVGS